MRRYSEDVKADVRRRMSPLLLGLQPLVLKAGYSAEDTPLPDERRLKRGNAKRPTGIRLRLLG